MDVLETFLGFLECKELIQLGLDKKGLANYMRKVIVYFASKHLVITYACISLFQGKWPLNSLRDAYGSL